MTTTQYLITVHHDNPLPDDVLDKIAGRVYTLESGIRNVTAALVVTPNPVPEPMERSV